MTTRRSLCCLTSVETISISRPLMTSKSLHGQFYVQLKFENLLKSYFVHVFLQKNNKGLNFKCERDRVDELYSELWEASFAASLWRQGYTGYEITVHVKSFNWPFNCIVWPFIHNTKSITAD